MPLDSALQAAIQKIIDNAAEHIEPVRKAISAVQAIHEAYNEPVPDIAALLGMQGGAAATSALRSYGPTEFHGTPLATAVKQILTDHSDGLTADDIHDLLSKHGFSVHADKSKAINNLKISLGKNMAFDRASNGFYVLAAGGTHKKRRRRRSVVASEEPADDVHEGAAPEEDADHEDAG